MEDTSPQAAAVQQAIYRRLTGAERLELAFDMSMTARELCLTRLRKEHPDWSELDLRREILRYAFLPADPPAPLR